MLQTTLRIKNQKMIKKIKNMQEKNNKKLNPLLIELIEKGFLMESSEHDVDEIGKVIEEKINLSLDSHNKKTETFLRNLSFDMEVIKLINIQAFLDLVPPEKAKDVKILYDEANKQASKRIKSDRSKIYQLEEEIKNLKERLRKYESNN